MLNKKYPPYDDFKVATIWNDKFSEYIPSLFSLKDYLALLDFIF